MGDGPTRGPTNHRSLSIELCGSGYRRRSGSAEKLYRRIVLSLPARQRWPAVKKIVDLWFPLYWRFRDNRWVQRALSRIAGIHFYHGQLPLSSREQNYEWSLLDTHDGMTDHFKRYSTIRSIRKILERLGAEEI